MNLPKGGVVAVVDGEKLNLFRNTAEDGTLKLTALPAANIDGDAKGSGARHQSSSANPDDSQIDEDGFAAGVAKYLNGQTTGGKVSKLVIVAAPKTLGELRKHYHKTLTAALVGEISKDLTGRSMAEIEKAVTAA